MKLKKRFLSILLSIVFIFGSLSPSISVYASNNSSSTGSNYLRNNFDKVVTWSTGVITGTRDLITNFFNYLGNHRNDLDIPEGTTTDDWLDDNILIDDNGGITISDSVINSMRDVVNNYITNDTGYRYVYSASASEFLNAFSTQTQYHAYLDLLRNNYDKICCQFNYGTTEIYVFEKPVDFVYSSYDSSTGTYQITTYFDWSINRQAYKYVYDSNSSQYVLYSDSPINISNNIRAKSEPNVSTFPSNTIRLVALNTTQYIMYNSLNALRAGTEGVQEYYVTDSYNTNHIDNSMTTTLNDLSNTISYSNVSNYVNSYYIENQTYPSSQDTYNYINNYNGDNGGGGNGNGNNNGSGNGFNFSFIGLIGDFIKGLLDGISSAIDGILNVLTTVVDLFLGQKDPITGNREGGIPSIIGEIIGYFLPFLPEWVPTLIEFSIIIAISLGIIKLIRGS